LQGPPVTRRLGRLLPITVLVAITQPAIAQSSSPAPLASSSPAGLQFIEVAPPSCQPGAFAMIPFLDSLRVELAGTGLRCCTLAAPSAPVSAAVPVRVQVETIPCGPSSDTVWIAVQDAARVAQRELSLTDVVPTARARTLALAVAELIRSLGQPSPDHEQAPPAIAVPAQAQAPAQPRSRVAIRVEGEARSLPTRDTLMWGARVRVAVPWRSLHLDLDLGVDQASGQVDLGSVQLRTATAGLGIGPRFASSMAMLDLGVRAEVGWAWVRGDTGRTTVQAGAGSDMVASLGLRASLELPARSKLRPSIALEGGGVVHGTRGEADGRSVVGMTGYYGLASIGLAVSP
jgi:hypothetical protein